MKMLDFIQAMIFHNIKKPHSKTLEPDRISPFTCDYDTVSWGGELHVNFELHLTFEL
jgi:hypothetical protein